ncbi:MAG: NAD(P)-dependent oxidoreductase [Oscillospiraceae bacterium]|nr:NAD(P)-dependent oxidoreductase [Oscillospiraceae bacterium]
MKYQNVLITGAAGRLGRFVYKHLEEQGYTITLFDQITPAQADPAWDDECNALFIKGSLNDLGDCMRAIQHAQADVIIHLAALPNDSDKTPRSIQNPRRRIQTIPEDTTIKSNVMGTYYLLDAARRLNVKKIIFASSFFTLGSGFRISSKPFQVDYLPLDEKHESRPEDTYSLSKVIGEEMLKAYARSYDIKCVSLRFLGVSFPFRQFQQVSIEQIKKEQAQKIAEKNSEFAIPQYVDARDIAVVCGLAIEKDLDSEFEAFFIATDSTCYDATQAEIVAVLRPDLAEMAKKSIPDGEFVISCKKLQDTYNWKPQYANKK